MGSPESEKARREDEKQHMVTVSSFWMAKYEVTQKQYEEIIGTNPSCFKGADLPVERVNWYMAVEFCNKLSIKYGLKPYYKIKKPFLGLFGKDPNNKDKGGRYLSDDLKWTVKIMGGNGFRLPTEAEWEYACRAGTKTAFHYGDKLDSTMANFRGDWPYNADSGVYRKKTTAVGSFMPNAWGLYDMHGNVAEWCWDWHNDEYYAKSPAEDPRGPNSGHWRVLRGGHWETSGSGLRSAWRNRSIADARTFCNGFRVVRSAF